MEQSLISGGFIVRRELRGSAGHEPIGAVVPEVAGPQAKWYQESPDMFVLFNTAQMQTKNPLLPMSPYGSLCWRGILQGQCLGEIGRRAAQVFGCDETAAFLSRLARLGFLKPIPGIDLLSGRPETITKDFDAPDIQFRLWQARIPWYCLWEICTVCDLRCRTCYLPNFLGQGPDRNGTKRILAEIIKTGIFYVSIMGGEPLLREDLEAIVGELRQNGVFVKIITNGQRLRAQRAQTLARAGLNHLEISLDGLSQQTHESSRGAGTYARSLEGLENARQSGIPRLGIVWTIHRDSLAELALLPEFLWRIGVSECYLSTFRKTGMSGASSPFEPLDTAALDGVRRTLDLWRQIHPEVTISLLPQCTCGRTSVVIGENGDVRVCPFLYSGLGNIHTRSFMDIWHSIGEHLRKAGPLGYCARTSGDHMC
jgi:MoaA/NifB/PqqE/SkfB family radical SAM enzyme